MVEYGFWARVSELIDTLDSRVPSMIGEIAKFQSLSGWIELSWHCWSLDESDYWFPHTFNYIINSLIASFQLWQCDINTCRKLVLIMPVYLIADNHRLSSGDHTLEINNDYVICTMQNKCCSVTELAVLLTHSDMPMTSKLCLHKRFLFTTVLYQWDDVIGQFHPSCLDRQIVKGIWSMSLPYIGATRLWIIRADAYSYVREFIESI